MQNALSKIGLKLVKWDGKGPTYQAFVNNHWLCFKALGNISEEQKITATLSRLEGDAATWTQLQLKEVVEGKKVLIAPMVADPNNANVQKPDYNVGLWPDWQGLIAFLKAHTSLDPKEDNNAFFSVMKVKEKNYPQFLQFILTHRTKTALMGGTPDPVKIALLKASLKSTTLEEMNRIPGSLTWDYNTWLNNLMAHHREKKEVMYTQSLIEGRREPEEVPMDVDARRHGKRKYHRSSKGKERRTWNYRSVRSPQGRKEKRKSSKRRHSHTRKVVTFGKGACFECGEKGHFKADCPKLQKKGKAVERKVRFMEPASGEESYDSAGSSKSESEEGSTSEEEYSLSEHSSDEDFRMAMSSRQ